MVICLLKMKKVHTNLQKKSTSTAWAVQDEKPKEAAGDDAHERISGNGAGS
jgi:hypothetical protein